MEGNIIYGKVISLTEEMKAQVEELLKKDKKAKINWILTVTQLSFEDLSKIADELGYKIKGEYIALPSEVDKLPDADIPKWKPVDVTQFMEISLEVFKYCPTCGNPVEGADETSDLTGHCPNCGEDFKKILAFDKKTDYFQKKCMRCGNLNPVKVKYCIHCSSRKLNRVVVNEGATRTEFKEPISPLKVYYFIDFALSFIVSIGVLIWGILEVATNLNTISTAIAITLIVVGGLICFWPMYRMYIFSQYLRYKWWGEDLEEIL